MKTFRYQDRKYHIVLTFYDKGALFYVVKFYGKYKQWWHYEIWTESEFKWKTKE